MKKLHWEITESLEARKCLSERQNRIGWNYLSPTHSAEEFIGVIILPLFLLRKYYMTVISLEEPAFFNYNFSRSRFQPKTHQDILDCIKFVGQNLLGQSLVVDIQGIVFTSYLWETQMSVGLHSIHPDAPHQRRRPYSLTTSNVIAIRGQSHEILLIAVTPECADRVRLLERPQLQLTVSRTAKQPREWHTSNDQLQLHKRSAMLISTLTQTPFLTHWQTWYKRPPCDDPWKPAGILWCFSDHSNVRNDLQREQKGKHTTV